MADVGDSPPQRFLFVYSSQVSALFIIIWPKQWGLSEKNGLREKNLKQQLKMCFSLCVQLLSHFKPFYPT